MERQVGVRRESEGKRPFRARQCRLEGLEEDGWSERVRKRIDNDEQRKIKKGIPGRS